MPVIDGWEASRLIREKENKIAQEKRLAGQEEQIHTPIIALTADESRDACINVSALPLSLSLSLYQHIQPLSAWALLAESCVCVCVSFLSVQAGMDDYLGKPVEKNAFYQMLQKISSDKLTWLQRSKKMPPPGAITPSDLLTGAPQIEKVPRSPTYTQSSSSKWYGRSGSSSALLVCGGLINLNNILFIYIEGKDSLAPLAGGGQRNKCLNRRSGVAQTRIPG